LFETGCNIENVSQTILQAEFSGIFIVAPPQGMNAAQVQQCLQERLLPLHQHVFAKALEQAPQAYDQPPSQPFVVTTQGPDRKGLVAGITEVIARFGANVTNLQAVFKGGMRPGDNIMIYEIDLPLSVDQQRFRAQLRETAASLGLEVSIQHRRIFETLNRI
jgi:glycine cleavage system transcriptional repressor